MIFIKKLIAAFFILLFSYSSMALEIRPYSPEAFAESQKDNDVVALQFHAGWCPTCRAQSNALNQWQRDNAVPGTLLVVDFDSERELKRQLNVRQQSTIILFKAGHEVARSVGVTDKNALRLMFESGQ